MYTMTAATIDSKERTIKRIITIKIKENMTNNLCISNELMKRKRKKKKNYFEKKNTQQNGKFNNFNADLNSLFLIDRKTTAQAHTQTHLQAKNKTQ